MKDGRDAIQKLVDGFTRNRQRLHAAETNEATIRLEYVDGFWRALGWDVHNVAQRSPAEKDVVAEAAVATYEAARVRARRPDYLFRIGGFPRFIVEAKRPAVDLATDSDAIFQAKTYAWSARIPFAILTSFERFRLFDCTVKPFLREPDRGIVRDFDLAYTDYVAQWDELLATFGQASVLDGSLDEEFNYAIPGGLESGEAATWRLAPNMFGEWARAPKDRDDMVLIVRPVRLDGPGGKPLSGPPLSAEEAKRLRELLATVQHDRGAELLATLDARDTAAQAWRAQAVAASVRAEAEHLRDRKAKADAARASLAKFVVEQARFYWHKDLVPEPVIDITVRNNTGHVVSRLHCRGVLSSPGRAAPWVEEDFVYAVRGGLQPGEQQQYKLAPNMFSSWGKAPRDRTDLVLTVTVVRLDGADEKELFPSDFAERDAKRLAALDKMVEPDGK